jgi:hypothetical protein
MFFRREKPHAPSFGELMDSLRKQGFDVQSEAGGGSRVSRNGCAGIVVDKGPGNAAIGKLGVLVGSELGQLCDGGYQKFWLTPSDVRVAATAAHLKALHAFEEDLREALGLISLYNESLGTTNELHLYDRVKDRDHGVPRRPWEDAR